ncbi:MULTISPECIES: aminoglycoside phosphotransferase family protein [Streptomyces]|uniref:Hydroxyurea phosphotransferase n=2 Tax=Streptomyces TaxID=1883 RepID=A0A100Y4W6_9ACTN|nr:MULTISPECIES: aminoglycoside phosphotransferase family protein [Streptomyces]KUH37752.1 hydroxyurea phosphotransferase [Streptomyces kanasensis]UUS34371.1 aminoglycoside phosphotransferase family protein [Streptomyces changanensis]
MRPPADIRVPDTLTASYAEGGEVGRAWLAALPGRVAEALEHWDASPDGEAASGQASLVLPVVLRHDGTRAVAKFQPPGEEAAAAVSGLRLWDGDGAVRLHDHDPATGAQLLERLDHTRTLEAVEDDDTALGVLGGLLARLVRVPAPPGLRGLGDVAAAMLERVPAAERALAEAADRRLLRTWAAAVAELAGDPGDRLLHWDLHYGNVLAGEREPWLAIDPEPLAGDPGFDLWPALDSRWDRIAASTDPARAVRRRFDLLTDLLALDRGRAAGWTLGRLLQNALWNVEDGERALTPSEVVISKALLHHR